VDWVANGGKVIEKKVNLTTSNIINYTESKPIDIIYKQAQKLHPNAEKYFISIPKDSTSSQYVFIKYKSRFDDAIIYFDQYTGKLLKTISWDDKNSAEKINFINYDIHVGSILGLPGKILAFFASLVSASLPITGFLIWWGR